MEMIRAGGLTEEFGDFTAVDRLAFPGDMGGVFGLPDLNVARKTTTIKMLCCLIGKTEEYKNRGLFFTGGLK